MIIVSDKQCSQCKDYFPPTNEYFHRNKNAKDGLTTACKDCAKAKSRLYHNEHKEHANAANAEWRKQHPEEMKAYKQTYVERHPDKVAESKQKYYDTHTDELYQKTKREREESPNHYAAHKAVQIAVKKGELSPIKLIECARCSNKAKHYHHWSYEPEYWLNVIPLCASCHIKEHAK